MLQLIKSGMEEQSGLLSISPMNLDEWTKYKIVQDNVQKGKVIYIGMIPMEGCLEKEVSFSRLRGKELVALKAKVRRLLSGLGNLVQPSC